MYTNIHLFYKSFYGKMEIYFFIRESKFGHMNCFGKWDFNKLTPKKLEIYVYWALSLVAGNFPQSHGKSYASISLQ